MKRLLNTLSVPLSFPQGRVFRGAACVAALALFVPFGCKKVEEKRIEKTAATAADSVTPPATTPRTGTVGAADPHAGMGTNPGNPADPHAGMAMGKPAAPHSGTGAGGMAMSGDSGAKSALAPMANDGTKSFGPFSLKMPKSWKETEVKKPMRLAQFAVGKPPVELVAYHFPGGGSVDANVNRWVGQFKNADGSPVGDKAKRIDQTIGGFEVTTLSVKGHYVAAMMPGQPGNHDSPDSQMLAAIVSAEKGRYFLKMVGPVKTLKSVEKDWNKMIKTLKKN